MDGFLAALTVVAALGCGLNAGVFFAFSSFVMKALARLQPALGIAAMQSINLVAVTPRSWRHCSGPPQPASRSPCGRWSTGTMRMALASRRQRGLPRRRDRVDDRLPRSPQQRPGGASVTARRGRRPLGAVRGGVDQMEPPARGRLPRRGGELHARAPDRVMSIWSQAWGGVRRKRSQQDLGGRSAW